MTAEEYFRITELFPVGVCVIDRDFRIIFWNRLLEDWTQKSLNDIRSKSLLDLYPHLRDMIFFERAEDVLSGGPPVIFTSELHKYVIPVFLPSGEPRIQTTTVLPFMMGSENVAVIVIEDVTELKKEVIAYRRMKDSAIIALNDRIKAEKEVFRANEEANLYLDIMSHDIANINMITSGYAALLEEFSDETVSDYAKRILIASSRSTEIISSVSTIRKLREKVSELSPVSLRSAVDLGISQYGNLRISMFDDDFMVMADDLLPEIFVNIVGNSIKYCGKDVLIAISAEISGNCVSICISDNGPGIPDDMKSEVFGKFKRGKGEREQGSGLGLYIVKMLIDRYGGTIAINDSEPGSKYPGTKVCISLKKG